MLTNFINSQDGECVVYNPDAIWIEENKLFKTFDVKVLAGGNNFMLAQYGTKEEAMVALYYLMTSAVSHLEDKAVYAKLPTPEELNKSEEEAKNIITRGVIEKATEDFKEHLEEILGDDVEVEAHEVNGLEELLRMLCGDAEDHDDD